MTENARQAKRRHYVSMGGSWVGGLVAAEERATLFTTDPVDHEADPIYRQITPFPLVSSAHRAHGAISTLKRCRADVAGHTFYASDVPRVSTGMFSEVLRRACYLLSELLVDLWWHQIRLGQNEGPKGLIDFLILGHE